MWKLKMWRPNLFQYNKICRLLRSSPKHGDTFTTACYSACWNYPPSASRHMCALQMVLVTKRSIKRGILSIMASNIRPQVLECSGSVDVDWSLMRPHGKKSRWVKLGHSDAEIKWLSKNFGIIAIDSLETWVETRQSIHLVPTRQGIFESALDSVPQWLWSKRRAARWLIFGTVPTIHQFSLRESAFQ